MEEIYIDQPCLNCKENCPGFSPHSWRKICIKCNCNRNKHDIKFKESLDIRNRVGLSINEGTSSIEKLNPMIMGYAWIPDGLTRSQVEEYFKELDPENVPSLGKEGELIRVRNIIEQTPRQDFEQKYCHQLKLSGQEKTFEEFNQMRKAAAMNVAIVTKIEKQGMICKNCNSNLNEGHLMIGLVGKDVVKDFWHPGCFKCSKCNKLLADLLYCEKGGEIFCGRHFAEQFCPRCEGCDELIFSGEYTRAMEAEWHSGHFACFRCDVNLSGHRYIVRDDHAYCVRCFEQLYANMCYECGTTIGSDSKDLSYKEMHWHEKCFKCCECGGSLADQQFAHTQNKLYCADCHDNKFAARCFKCDKIFKSGMKKYDYKGQQWHSDCFVCSECRQPIGSMQFVPRSNEFVCIRCYDDKYAQKCAKCKEVIMKGGVSYKEQPYHRECFICCNCAMILAGEKFITNDNQPFCSNCYDSKFAKKCKKCELAISGTGGSTKYVTFEDQTWHSACFECTKCSCSLVGQGFIVEGDKILCAECAVAN